MSNNKGSTGQGYAKDHHVENIFPPAHKTQNHKQASENIIIVFLYILQRFLSGNFEKLVG